MKEHIVDNEVKVYCSKLMRKLYVWACRNSVTDIQLVKTLKVGLPVYYRWRSGAGFPNSSNQLKIEKLLMTGAQY